jgi:quinol monooxygenase YgiN
MITIIGQWNMKPGKEVEATKALKKLAADVKRNEPGTLCYLVHIPDMKGFNQPTPSPTVVSFYEVYATPAALTAHVNGAFSAFKAKHKDLFLTMRIYLPDGTFAEDLYVTGNSVKRLAGFMRAASQR